MGDGRKLDAEIHTRLFGKSSRHLWACEADSDGARDYCRLCSLGGPDYSARFADDICSAVPRYSETWAQAGLVIDALSQRGWRVRIDAFSEVHCPRARVRATLTNGQGPIEAVAETIPLAICRAALAAVEVL